MSKRLILVGALIYTVAMISSRGTIKGNALGNTESKNLIIPRAQVETPVEEKQFLIAENLHSSSEEIKETEIVKETEVVKEAKETIKTEGIKVTEEAKEDEKSEDTGFFYEKPEKKPEKVKIVVYKKARILELYGDNNVIGRFKIALGRNPEGDKNKEGDGKTPEGEYYICTRNAESSFHRFLGISYPNVEDAQRGLDSGLINKKIFNSIKNSQELKKQPAWDTPLGGAVGIHGGGNASDWTLGCIALENKAVDIVWEYAKIKTPVFIYE